MAQTSISLSPNSLGGGNLPSGYDVLTFSQGDGNWIDRIKLPERPINNSQVTITSQATYGSYIVAAPAQTPFDAFIARTGDNYVFVYDAAAAKWKVGGSSVKYLTPNDAGAVIPDNPTHVTFYSTGDGNWLPNIQLPKVAKHNDIVVVRSSATYDSWVAGDNLLYASTTLVRTNDTYVFKFSGTHNRWAIEASPVRTVNASNVNPMNPPTSPRTSINFYDGHWGPQITLPATAGDRDIIVIKSTATYGTNITPTNVINPAALGLTSGDEYEFIYLAESKKWGMMRCPETVYQMAAIAGGNLPGLSKPRTVIYSSDGNYHSTLTLPAAQPVGCRVVVKSTATWSFSVSADGKAYPVNTGDTVSFVVNANKLWEKEAVMICGAVGGGCDAK